MRILTYKLLLVFYRLIKKGQIKNEGKPMPQFESKTTELSRNITALLERHEILEKIVIC